MWERTGTKRWLYAAGRLGAPAVLGLVVGLAGCQSAGPVAGTDRGSAPIVHGDTGPAGCPAGSIARIAPTSGENACFYGGGCGEGLVPVRLDQPGGSTVQCGRLDATGCGTDWSAGSGFVDGSTLCLGGPPPCDAPVNRTEMREGAWTVVLDCR